MKRLTGNGGTDYNLLEDGLIPSVLSSLTEVSDAKDTGGRLSLQSPSARAFQSANCAVVLEDRSSLRRCRFPFSDSRFRLKKAPPNSRRFSVPSAKHISLSSCNFAAIFTARKRRRIKPTQTKNIRNRLTTGVLIIPLVPEALESVVS